MAYKRNPYSVYDLEYRIVLCVKYRHRALHGNITEKCIEVIKKICFANYVDVINET